MQGKYHFEALIIVKIFKLIWKLSSCLFFYNVEDFNAIKKNKEIKFNRDANEVAADLRS